MGTPIFCPTSKWVNLGFYQGVGLADPEGLLEGTGAKMRHVKIRSLDDAQATGGSGTYPGGHLQFAEKTQGR